MKACPRCHLRLWWWQTTFKVFGKTYHAQCGRHEVIDRLARVAANL